MQCNERRLTRPRLQWLRGPRTLQAALAAYDKHLGTLAARGVRLPQ